MICTRSPQSDTSVRKEGDDKLNSRLYVGPFSFLHCHVHQEIDASCLQICEGPLDVAGGVAFSPLFLFVVVLCGGVTMACGAARPRLGSVVVRPLLSLSPVLVIR